MLLVKRLGPSSGDKRYINAIAIAIAIDLLQTKYTLAAIPGILSRLGLSNLSISVLISGIF